MKTMRLFFLVPLLLTASTASAQQTGGLPSLSERVAVLEEMIGKLEARIEQNTATILQLQGDLTAERAARVAGDEALASALASLDARVGDLETWGDFFSLTTLDDGMGGPLTTVRLAGANLQVVNGTGTTDGPPNGLGNVVVGYNELGRSPFDVRTGSHMLVAGTRNSYSGYGGLVVGVGHLVSASYGTVAGGANNIVGGDFSAVYGGFAHIASGLGSVILGGQDNRASGLRATVVGGTRNEARGLYSSIGGGEGNFTLGQSSVIGGGYQNQAEGIRSVISGGRDTVTTTEFEHPDTHTP